MAKFTKENLVSGLFGKLSDGDVFVVAGDKLIYEGGKYDDISGMDDDLVFENSHNYVTEVCKAMCFDQVRENRGIEVIWKRGEEKEEAEEAIKSVTITEDEFFEVVKKANEKWKEIADEVPGKEMVNIIMGMQNITFGAVIGAVLFDKEIK